MEASFERNEVLDKLPRHLLDLVIDQPYDNYTAQDHAVWRYVMRQNVNFLGRVAHKSYLDGLKKTGISIDTIPHMYGMNRILKEIGWAAVAVDGFIPPQAFMEFQAYKVLVIAADIRNINHIHYTPAPDIIHEAAGHAPIIADEEYSAYLKLFGEIGAKAFSSKKDYELYEAIRHLSIIKEDPNTPQHEVTEAEKAIERIQADMGKPSEMALIRNLHWWTVEYGLIGSVDDFKIYGAGLLSSIGESSNCVLPGVKKLPYSLDAVNYSFDITTQQPHLFVTPSFQYLSQVLNEFSESMAFRRGGTYALRTAIESGHIGTVELSSGLQVSGTFSRMICDHNDEAVYFATNTPTQLCASHRQMEGHGKDYHAHGFSSPLGKVKGADKSPEDLTDQELAAMGLSMGSHATLEFTSGVKVSGKVTGHTRDARSGKLLLIIWSDATVTYKDEVLFDPAWGTYDMAVGESIVSAYSGPADPQAFLLNFEAPEEKTHKILYSESAKELHKLYTAVRNIRETGQDQERLRQIFNELKTTFRNDWLLGMEILEIIRSSGTQADFGTEVERYLVMMAEHQPSLQKLIHDGLGLINNNFELVH
jgi:phenylalanine-4-hydroxylase